MDLTSLFATVSTKYKLPFEKLKPEQFNVIDNLLKGNNVFAFLPIGYGKSVCAYLPPVLLDEVRPDLAPHVALIISPLQSLMRDKLDECRKIGLNAVMITERSKMTDESIEAIRNCSASVIFAPPEALEDADGEWISYLRSHRRRVCLLVYDETHCLSERSLDFQPAYSMSAWLRSIFNVPCLGLSSTINGDVLQDIREVLHIPKTHYKVISLPPNRGNLFLNVIHKRQYDYEVDLMWLVEGIRSKKEKYPKTVIFVPTVNQAADMYLYMMYVLKKDAYCKDDCEYDSRFLSMFHELISKSLHSYTLNTFLKEDSILRVLICTIWVGIDIPDIRQVVFWGNRRNLLCQWQDIGRCGRDGRPAEVTWYPKRTVGADFKVFDGILTDETMCVRKYILESFMLPQMDLSLFRAIDSRKTCTSSCDSCECDSCRCCSHCRSKCKCFNTHTKSDQ